MKKKTTSLLTLLLTTALAINAQNKVIIKVEVNQQEALTARSLENPIYEGDNAALQVEGGTFPYSYNWEKLDDESRHTHQVTVKDDNNCTATIYINIKATGIDDLDQAGMAVYPNPTTDILYVPLPPNTPEARVLLISPEGILLYSKTVKTDLAQWQLSLASCPAGQYFVQVVSEKNTKTYTIIKQ